MEPDTLNEATPKPVDPFEPIKTAPSEVQKVIKRVLLLEKDSLYKEKPQLKSDVVAILREEVQ